ncbi:MAG: vanadium-dependent haloperoxidase [Sandaracinaceae bacterium]|nr:vanadium-dependent haloperoxidase [Sandaracinaceae bacterium]
MDLLSSRDRGTAALWVVACVLVGGCSGGPRVRPAPAFEEAAGHPGAAVLSVAATAADDVWLVGAQPAVGARPLALRFDGSAWTTVDTGILHDLWWVHGFPDGPVFVAGGGASVLRIDGDAVERLETPPFFGNTVFGVWGSTPTDLWAVGGFAGRDGFVWRSDGTAFREVPLPSDLPRTEAGELPALFKVWGRAADDVWIVGGLGTVLHWDGDALTVVPSGTTASLFTVTGSAREVVIVGGRSQGVVLRGGVDGFVDDAPADAPLLQAVTVAADRTVWVAGENGYAARSRRVGEWELVDLGWDTPPESVHALYAAPDTQLWAVGGGVLTPALDQGQARTSATVPEVWAPDPVVPPSTTCPAAAVDVFPTGTIARRWSEQLLNSIRRDIPHPPKHARNLFHVAVAMYDAWAAYDATANGVVVQESHVPGSAADVDTAISYAALRVLQHRYATAVGGATSLDCYTRFMGVLGLDPSDTSAVGDTPAAVGNRIGNAVIARFADDGANEANNYADTTAWTPVNSPMVVDRLGTNVTDPDVWQQLNLATAETQNGIVLDTTVQPYIGAHWRDVEPFAVQPDMMTGRYGDPGGSYPSVSDPEMVDWVVQVIRRTAQLDVDDGATIDISPGAFGNNALGADDGTGYATNPVTGGTYAPNVVPRGDFARVMAEFWADGPTSETPPGHWLVLANEVSDELPGADLRPFGAASAVDRLAWDVGIYLTVTSATHDAAVVAWAMKRDSLGPRPITLIRYMAQLGQRSDTSLPSYDAGGLPLMPGLIELITAESSAPGERHEHLRWFQGELAVRGWRGEPGDRANDYTPVGWMRAREWIPYQRRTFVTPAFPGFISGHSTFSRAAAEALTAYTGSPYFPGGFHEYVAPANRYLVFEDGPSVDVHLQWARYADAADQAGQSRLYGGIHIWPDDRIGRINGAAVGMATSARAQQYIEGALP